MCVGCRHRDWLAARDGRSQWGPITVSQSRFSPRAIDFKNVERPSRVDSIQVQSQSGTAYGSAGRHAGQIELDITAYSRFNGEDGARAVVRGWEITRDISVRYRRSLAKAPQYKDRAKQKKAQHDKC